MPEETSLIWWRTFARTPARWAWIRSGWRCGRSQAADRSWRRRSGSSRPGLRAVVAYYAVLDLQQPPPGDDSGTSADVRQTFSAIHSLGDARSAPPILVARAGLAQRDNRSLRPDGPGQPRDSRSVEPSGGPPRLRHSGRRRPLETDHPPHTRVLQGPSCPLTSSGGVRPGT